MVDHFFVAEKVEVIICNDEYLTSAYFSASDGHSYWAFSRFEDPYDDDGSVYIERDDQAWSTHGGVQVCTLHRDSLRLILSEGAAQELKIDRQIQIMFSLSESDYIKLMKAVGSMFRDH